MGRPSGEGETITALRPLRAIIALFTGVAAGLVEPTMATTTPTGLAISVMPVSGSSRTTPTDRWPSRSRRVPNVLRRFLATLSS